MSFTVFDAVINASEKVGVIHYGETTASSGTTSVEDQTVSSAHADDQFAGGTIAFLRSGGTSSTSIEKQLRLIDDYDASSGQFSFSALATSADTGTIYGVITPEFNLQLLERLTNASLRTLGPLVYTDRTMQSSANQRVYALTTLANRSRPFKVEILGRTGSSSDDPDWVKLHGWDIQPSTVAAGHNIVFPRYLPSGRDILIHYEQDHQNLTASTATIDDRLHPELVTLALVEKMYEYRNSRSRGAQEFDVQRWNDAKRQLAEARVRWPVYRNRRVPDINVFGGGVDTERSQAPPFGSLE